MIQYDFMLDLFSHTLYVIIFGAGVIILPGLVIGLIVSIFQAATQINESTISFFPKLIVILVMVAFVAPWLMRLLADFTTNLLMEVPRILG